MILHPNTRRNTIQHDCACQVCRVQRAQREAMDLRLTWAAVIMAAILFIAIPALRTIAAALPVTALPVTAGDPHSKSAG